MADGSLLPMDGDTLPDGSVPLRFTPSLPLYPASFAPASQITCLQRVPPSNVAEGGTPPGGYPIHLRNDRVFADGDLGVKCHQLLFDEEP